MPEAAIALGSNLPSHWGDRRRTLETAVGRLKVLGDVEAVSSLLRYGSRWVYRPATLSERRSASSNGDRPPRTAPGAAQGRRGDGGATDPMRSRKVPGSLISISSCTEKRFFLLLPSRCRIRRCITVFLCWRHSPSCSLTGGTQSCTRPRPSCCIPSTSLRWSRELRRDKADWVLQLDLIHDPFSSRRL